MYESKIFDTAPGTDLLTLPIRDLDGPGNGAPFKAVIIYGDGKKAFGIENNFLK